MEPLAGRLYAAARAAAGMSVSKLSSGAGVPESIMRSIERSEDFGAKGMPEVRSFLSGLGIIVDEYQRTVSMKAGADDVLAGRVLAAGRHAAGLKQKDLAALSGISTRTVNAIENGSSSTTAVRDAISGCLARRGIFIVRQDGRWIVHVRSREDAEPGEWQFPDGREDTMSQDFVRRVPDDKPELLRLRVEISETHPLVWREILIPENATFADLHATLQIAFGWQGQHLHEFQCGVVIGRSLDFEGPGPAPLDERLVKLTHMVNWKQSFTYLYDFADGWEHLVKVGERIPRGVHPPRPSVTDGEGAPIVENSGGASCWNELADRLRKGRASQEELDWLYKCGYGRDYDPDRLDIVGINRLLAESGFDIAPTWKGEFRRMRSLTVSAPWLRDDYPAPPPEPRRPGRQYEIVSVEPFTEAQFERDGVSDPKQAICHMVSLKMRSVPVRLEIAELVHLLDQASDVISFRSFPLAVRWRAGGRSGVFHPDMEIVTDKGTFIVHVAFDDEECDFVLDLSRRTGKRFLVVTSGFLDGQVIANCKEVHRWSRMEAGIYRGIPDVLGSEALAKGIPMREAVRILAANGYGKEEGVIASNPEMRAQAKVLAAVAAGIIGMDFTKPNGRTKVGTPALTWKTCRFWAEAGPYLAA